MRKVDILRRVAPRMGVVGCVSRLVRRRWDVVSCAVVGVAPWETPPERRHPRERGVSADAASLATLPRLSIQQW